MGSTDKGQSTEAGAHSGDEHPVDVLKAEHRVIVAVMDAMDHEAEAVAGGGRLKPDFWGDVVDFIETFADRCHHGKEEDLLFRCLVEQGMPEVGSPVSCMKHEHIEARALKDRLDKALRNRDREEVHDAALAYTHLLRTHIEKEETILFELARAMLPPDQVELLRKGFDAVERNVMGEETHCRYIQMARRLCAESGVAFCCGH